MLTTTTTTTTDWRHGGNGWMLHFSSGLIFFSSGWVRSFVGEARRGEAGAALFLWVFGRSGKMDDVIDGGGMNRSATPGCFGTPRG